jgi:hypothetical protein
MGRIAAVLGTATLVIGLLAFGSPIMVGAQGTGTGTGTGTGPPGDPCSPGYFKNHLEDWVGLGCGDYCGGATDGQLLDDLQAKGPGSGAIRHAAAACLNECTGCTE